MLHDAVVRHMLQCPTMRVAGPGDEGSYAGLPLRGDGVAALAGRSHAQLMRLLLTRVVLQLLPRLAQLLPPRRGLPAAVPAPRQLIPPPYAPPTPG
jgi:hypothetical protein